MTGSSKEVKTSALRGIYITVVFALFDGLLCPFYHFAKKINMKTALTDRTAGILVLLYNKLQDEKIL